MIGSMRTLGLCGFLLAGLSLDALAEGPFTAGQSYSVRIRPGLTVGELIDHQKSCYTALADDLGMQTQGRAVRGDREGMECTVGPDAGFADLWVHYNQERLFTLQSDQLIGMAPDAAATAPLAEYLERVHYGVYRLKGLHLEFNLDPDDYFSDLVNLVLPEGLPKYQLTTGPGRFGETDGPGRSVTALQVNIPGGYSARGRMVNAITHLPSDVLVNSEVYASCLIGVK